MTVMTGAYLGEKKVVLTHEDSGTKLYTAAPLDNNGDGSSFSPTDLFSVSLAACMMTIIGISAERDGVSLDGSTFKVEKIMSTVGPRRISELQLEFHFPQSIEKTLRDKYERAAMTCPVHQSLHPEIKVVITYQYDR